MNNVIERRTSLVLCGLGTAGLTPGAGRIESMRWLSREGGLQQRCTKGHFVEYPHKTGCSWASSLGIWRVPKLCGTSEAAGTSKKDTACQQSTVANLRNATPLRQPQRAPKD